MTSPLRASLTYTQGDLFGAPGGSILVHACNTAGKWGAGIALEFRTRYPEAFAQYNAHCAAHSPDDLVGTCLLLQGDDAHDIACLFTSRGYGKRKDSPECILAATGQCVANLLTQNAQARKPLHACQFNSGKFGVPWDATEAILVALGVEMTVYLPPESGA
ncbi:hypothetical protein PLICRDRAFT_39616 [Plicaturopsis crispa FD-325 SS-3]|nr:hypothetical protein PLICRDRAFT_39616 [Plicaturopsis crispa FD-325 SS-3]